MARERRISKKTKENRALAPDCHYHCCLYAQAVPAHTTLLTNHCVNNLDHRSTTQLRLLLLLLLQLRRCCQCETCIAKHGVCKQSENHAPSVLCVCLHRTSHVSIGRFVGFLALPHRSNYAMHVKNALSFGYCRIFCAPFLAHGKIHSGDTPKWTQNDNMR